MTLLFWDCSSDWFTAVIYTLKQIKLLWSKSVHHLPVPTIFLEAKNEVEMEYRGKLEFSDLHVL